SSLCQPLRELIAHRANDFDPRIFHIAPGDGHCDGARGEFDMFYPSIRVGDANEPERTKRVLSRLPFRVVQESEYGHVEVVERWGILADQKRRTTSRRWGWGRHLVAGVRKWQ